MCLFCFGLLIILVGLSLGRQRPGCHCCSIDTDRVCGGENFPLLWLQVSTVGV